MLGPPCRLAVWATHGLQGTNHLVGILYLMFISPYYLGISLRLCTVPRAVSDGRTEGQTDRQTNRQTDRRGGVYMKLAMLSWMQVWERKRRAIWPSLRLRCLSISTEEGEEGEVVVEALDKEEEALNEEVEVVLVVVEDATATTCVSIAIGRGGEKDVRAVIISLVVVGGRGGHEDMSIKPWEAQKSRKGLQRIHFSNLLAARTMAALASGAETRERAETGVVAVVGGPFKW